MAGVMYLGNQMVSPVIVQGGGEPEPFPVIGVEAVLASDGYIDGDCMYIYSNLYSGYKDLPFYFDGKNIEAIEYGGPYKDKVRPLFHSSFADSSIKYIDFSNLSHLPSKQPSGGTGRGYFFRSIISGTTNVHIYFRALTTQTYFPTDAFHTLCKGSTNAVIHFPSNLESIISGLRNYPNFGGKNTTIAFDLEPTS